MVHPPTAPRVRAGLALLVGVALAACGRVSLGSRELLGSDSSEGSGAGSGNDSGAAGASGAFGGAAGGMGPATGLGAEPGAGGTVTGASAGAGGSAAGGPSRAGASAGGSSPLGSVDADAPGEPIDGGSDAAPSAALLPPSCRETNPVCGDGLDRASCCESLPVPGGRFELRVDVSGATVPVTISSFRLDRFEVTVGRMREFIAHYDEWRALGQPEQGLGAHPRIAGSGWQAPRFSEQLPGSAEEFEARLRECGTTPFSTYADGLSDEVPLNCASWYEAAAFCAWDGGRLPTLRELAYANTGGAEQRIYPWGDEPIPRRELALFGCIIDTAAPVCTIDDVTPVGVRPLGAGAYGHDDLAGSMSEWVLDVEAPLVACTDCADLSDESLRRWRAGNWLDRADLMKNDLYFALPPELRIYFLGLRCARDD